MVEPSEPGIRTCIRCDWLFVSPDRVRVRRCADCKLEEESFSPREAKQASTRDVPDLPE